MDILYHSQRPYPINQVVIQLLRTSGTTLALTALLLSATTDAAEVNPHQVSETTLDNGMHVVVKSVPYGNLVAIGFVIKASPLYERPDEHGLAELVRHMVFDVPEGNSDGVATRIRDLGGTFSSFTSPDATQVRMLITPLRLDELFPPFVESVFEAHFNEARWAEHLPHLRKQLQRAQQTPAAKLDTIMWSTAFQKHPYSRRPLPDAERVSDYNTDDLAALYERLYVPNNAALIAVGDVAPERVFALARRHINDYQPRPLQMPPVPAEPVQTQVRTRLAKANASKTIISYGWHAPGIDRKRDVCALDLIYALLGEGETAWLERALDAAEQEQAAANVEFITKRDPGLFIINCATNPDAEFEVRQVVLDTVKKLRESRITQEQLADAKALIRAGYIFDNATYSDQVGSMAFYEAIDTYQFAIDYLAEVAKVTAEDIQQVARRYLDPSRHTLVIIRPEGEGGQIREARSRL